MSACTQQEANAKEFNLFTKASLLSDPVAVDLDIIQSQGPGYYTLENMYGCGCGLKDARKVQLSQAAINFEGGKGWIGEKGCLVDNDTNLRQDKDKLTNDRQINQVFERLSATTPNLTKGYYDYHQRVDVSNNLFQIYTGEKFVNTKCKSVDLKDTTITTNYTGMLLVDDNSGNEIIDTAFSNVVNYNKIESKSINNVARDERTHKTKCFQFPLRYLQPASQQEFFLDLFLIYPLWVFQSHQTSNFLQGCFFVFHCFVSGFVEQDIYC